MKPNNSHDNLSKGIYDHKKPIEIHFRTLMGKGDKLILQPNCKIQQLTERIAKILKDQPTHIQLYCLGRYLKKKQSTLQQYGLRDGSIVHVQYFYEHFRKTRVSLPQEHRHHYNVFQRYSQNARQVAVFLKIKGQNFEIPISNQQTVRNLKQQIQKRSNYKADYLCLQHLGKEMIDENTLQQSGIHSSAWISGQYHQPPPRHQNKFYDLLHSKSQQNKTMTSQMFENIEQIQFDERYQDEDDEIYKNDHQDEKNGKTNINNIINNTKLSQSIQILSPYADVEIPYQYNFQDSGSSKFLKKSGFNNHYTQKQQVLKMEKSSPNQLTVDYTPKKQNIKKFQGHCQVKLKDIEDTISYTIDCLKSSFKTKQVKTLISKAEKCRNQKNEIILLNPTNLKVYNQDKQICELPWQSIILNDVLYVNFVFTWQKQSQNAA